MHKRIVRSDGSVVILTPRHESQSVTWEIMFKVGSRQERKSINGVSHFIEHLMFKGTKKRPDTQVLSRELDSVGAEYNAFTGKDHTGYYIQTDAKNIKLGVDMLSDMLHHAKFDPAEMERERSVIVEELNMYRDNPVMRIDEIFETLLFKGSPLGWEIGGPRRVIRSLSHKDLLSFKNRFYYPGNMVIGLAGKFTEAQALKLIDRYFPVKKKKDKAAIKKVALAQDKPRIIIERKKTDQVQLMLGFPGFSYNHKDAHSLMVLSVIMGGTMSSRLFIQIRERKGLAYRVRAMSESFEDTGYFAVQAGLDKQRIYEALEAIKDELVLVKKKGVTGEELRRAKDNIRGRLILKFERPSSYLSYLMSQEILTNRIDDLEQMLSKIERVKLKDVKRVAQRIISWRKANLALIGPFTDKKKFLTIVQS